MFSIEPLTRLYEEPDDHGQPVFLEIGTDPDMPSLVQLRTADSASIEYFGEIRLSLTPEKAEQLAKAILSVAKSVRELDKT